MLKVDSLITSTLSAGRDRPVFPCWLGGTSSADSLYCHARADFSSNCCCVDGASCFTLTPCFRVEGTSSLESSAWEFKARETGQSKLTTGLCRVDILRPSISILVCVIYWVGAGCTHASERGGQRTTWRGWFSPPTMRIKLRSLCSAASALTH